MRALLALAAVGAGMMAWRQFARQPGEADSGIPLDWLPVWTGAQETTPDGEPVGRDWIGEQRPGGAGFLGMVQDVMTTTTTASDMGDTNVAAFLQMIRAAEGTAGPNGYRTLFGGALFEAFNDHPRVRFYEKADEFIRNGKKDYTTAAGAFQITETTYNRLARKLGVSGFAPEVQDRMAVELIREARALDDVRAGRIEAAIGKTKGIWASLPGATYGQPTRSMQFARTAYEKAGGVYA